MIAEHAHGERRDRHERRELRAQERLRDPSGDAHGQRFPSVARSTTWSPSPQAGQHFHPIAALVAEPDPAQVARSALLHAHARQVALAHDRRRGHEHRVPPPGGHPQRGGAAAQEPALAIVEQRVERVHGARGRRHHALHRGDHDLALHRRLKPIAPLHRLRRVGRHRGPDPQLRGVLHRHQWRARGRERARVHVAPRHDSRERRRDRRVAAHRLELACRRLSPAPAPASARARPASTASSCARVAALSR